MKRNLEMNLSQHQFEEGVNKILNNAEDIIDDSKILYEKGHYPRSYYLSSMAEEEVGKFFNIMAAYMVKLGGNVNLANKFFSQAFGDHLKKRELGYIMPDAINAMPGAVPTEADLLNLTCFDPEMAKKDTDYVMAELLKYMAKKLEYLLKETNESDIKALGDLKLSSLYVDFDETTNNFLAPKDNITKDMAENNLKSVTEKFGYMKYFRDIVKIIPEKGSIDMIKAAMKLSKV